MDEAGEAGEAGAWAAASHVSGIMTGLGPQGL